jgi:acylphosphatase
MQKCIEGLIEGRNLKYKDLLWIYRHAIRLGLKGLTFFKNDGSIKIIAEGEERNLLFFIRKLKRGRFLFPIFSLIENISITWHEPRNEFNDFSISQTT